MSSTTGANRPTISQKTQSFLQANPQIALALPAPEETWFKRDVDPITHRAIHILSRNGAIERDAIEFRDDQGNSKIIRWRTTTRVHEFVSEHVSEPSLTPCGHTGVQCLVAGETYTCSDKRCEATFGPAVAREVLDG
jgi:hypothetical protein